MEKPDNNLVFAIVCLLLCCLPAGVVSLVFSLQVDNKWAVGDYQGAAESARKAKTWALVGMIAGPILYIAFGLVYFLVLAAAVSTSTNFTVVTTR